MSDETRVLLIKRGETLLVAVPDIHAVGADRLGTIGKWFEQMCGINVLFIMGETQIGKADYEPCHRGNQMGECVLQEGHEKIEGDGPGAISPGPNHVDRQGRNWGVGRG